MEFEPPPKQTDYDEVPYPGKFYPQSSPPRLATLATLFGLAPAPVDHCRVLELGCGDGGNLIPLAYALPGSHFLGIDLSSTAVATGRAKATELGIANLQVCAQNLLDFPTDAGAFDYILAHGIYSWTPKDARQQLFKICARHLSTNGVAYISYNALPGGYLRFYPRELMRFHTRAIHNPAVKTKEARNILEFAIAAHPNATVERELLKQELAANQMSDSFMYHDILSDVNEPVYFLDFLDQAAAHGLQFLAEADPQSMSTIRLPEPVRSQLESLPDRRLREQYLDFIYCRRFRQTVLCRTGHPLASHFDPEALNRLFIAGALQPAAPLTDLNDTDLVEFRTPRGQVVKVTEAVPKAIYLTLSDAYPLGLSYDELVARTCARLQLERESLAEDVEDKIVRMLLSSYQHGAVELRTFHPGFATTLSDRPCASAVARMAAAKEVNIASLALTSHALPDALARHLLTLLDGTRDRRQLLEAMETADTRRIEDALQMLLRGGMLRS